MKLNWDNLEGLRVADHKGRITLGSKYAGKQFAVQEAKDGSTVLIPVRIVPEHEPRLTSNSLTDLFVSLETLHDNWDGYGSPSPTPSLLTKAQEVLALLHAGALARGLRWEDPHVGVNERGQITLEWWKAERSLTVFVRTQEQVDYLKAWGTDIGNEMEDGELNRLEDFVLLSQWLYPDHGEKA